MNRIDSMNFGLGEDGKAILISFRLLSVGGGDNVTMAVAFGLIDHEAFRNLPEPVVWEPEEWFGFGAGYPLRVRVDGRGADATMKVMWNGSYSARRYTERTALLELPSILSAKGALAAGQEAILQRLIGDYYPEP